MWRAPVNKKEKLQEEVEACKKEEGKMKKVIAVCIAAFMVLALGSASFADEMSTDKTISITLGVTGQFGFTVWDEDLSQSFTLNPGEAALADLHIAASSNHGNQWTISAASDGLAGQFNFGVLPVQISTFDGGAAVAPAGTFVDNLVLGTGAQAIYTAAAGEWSVQGLEISGLIIVPTAVTTTEDLYVGNVILTMAD